MKKDQDNDMTIRAVKVGTLEAVVDQDIVVADIIVQTVIKAEEDGLLLPVLQILILVLPTVNTKERKEETIRRTRKIKSTESQRYLMHLDWINLCSMIHNLLEKVKKEQGICGGPMGQIRYYSRSRVSSSCYP